MVNFKVRKLYGVKFSIAILSVIFMSWLLYPFAVSWIFGSFEIQVGNNYSFDIT